MNNMLVFSYIWTEIIYMVYFWQAGIYSQRAYKFISLVSTKPNLVAKILATNFGVFKVIFVMFSKICLM